MAQGRCPTWSGSRATARSGRSPASTCSDPRLRVVLTFQSLLVGGNPFATTSVYCLIAFLERRWGVHFPMGGTGASCAGWSG